MVMVTSLNIKQVYASYDGLTYFLRSVDDTWKNVSLSTAFICLIHMFYHIYEREKSRSVCKISESVGLYLNDCRYLKVVLSRILNGDCSELQSTWIVWFTTSSPEGQLHYLILLRYSFYFFFSPFSCWISISSFWLLKNFLPPEVIRFEEKTPCFYQQLLNHNGISLILYVVGKTSLSVV